jgi:hypothetical protein
MCAGMAGLFQQNQGCSKCRLAPYGCRKCNPTWEHRPLPLLLPGRVRPPVAVVPPRPRADDCGAQAEGGAECRTGERGAACVEKDFGGVGGGSIVATTRDADGVASRALRATVGSHRQDRSGQSFGYGNEGARAAEEIGARPPQSRSKPTPIRQRRCRKGGPPPRDLLRGG